MSIFDSCKLESSFDEMYDSSCNTREHWLDIIDGLEKAGIKQLEQKQTEIDWRLEDNGVKKELFLLKSFLHIKVFYLKFSILKIKTTTL